jgi:hypothetical protein
MNNKVEDIRIAYSQYGAKIYHCNDRRRDNKEKKPNSAYICLDEVVDKPRTEIGIGALDQLEKFEPAVDSPFALLVFRDRGKEYCSFARIYIPQDHKYITEEMLSYINKVKCSLIDYMREQNPDSDLKASVSVHKVRNNAALAKIKKRIKAEEIVEYVQY